MTISKWEATDKPILEAQKLMFAMSRVDSVLEAFCSQNLLTTEETGGFVSLGMEKQDDFAEMVESCWTDLGPSDRYFKRLIMQFTRLVERNGDLIESDLLADLVARASLINTDGAPDDLESCYVSFFLDKPESSENYMPLKIRVFPHHNDVALRLWEAGNSLAEFFISNPDLIAGKSLFELGSGCAATALAIAACCKPSKIHLTDYTEACQLNMEHNLLINQEWLSYYDFSPNRISQSYLEWGTFVMEYTSKKNAVDNKVEAGTLDETYEAFTQADILFAADVIYDINDIDNLIQVVRCFLIDSPTTKQAIFSSTKRNVATFEFFLETIRKHGMEYTWIARNEECESLKRIFEGNYVQKRSDVQICRIEMPPLQESETFVPSTSSTNK